MKYMNEKQRKRAISIQSYCEKHHWDRRLTGMDEFNRKFLAEKN